MARGVNKVILVGNLGGDPETRSMPSGMTVTNIRIATSESWKDKASGAQQERTEWHSIALFGRLGEIAAEYLRKGSQVFIEGKLRTRKWQDKQGNDRFTTEIIADNMQMLGGRGGGGGGGMGGGGTGGGSGGARALCAAARGLRSIAGAGGRQRRLRRRHSVLARSVVFEPLPRKQGVGEAELGQIADPERIENPIQVIHLMLYHAGVEIAHCAVDRPALRVEARVAQLPIARHQTAHAGHGEASFPPFLDLFTERRELGVD